MNRKNLESALVNTPETSVKVSDELHQDIMRAVRQVEPVRRKATFSWMAFSRFSPALAAGALAVIVAAVIFYPHETDRLSPLPGASPVTSQVQSSAGSLLSLGEGLLAISEETPVPETELRKEIERLKSDLARFDFRS